MTLILPLIIFIHGLIHLMGFVKAYGLAELPQLGHAISRPAGMAWLTAAALFSISATAQYFNKDWWWIAALAAVIISQILIIGAWQDAKFGTGLNVLILFVALVGAGEWKFQEDSKRQLAEFLAGRTPQRTVVTREMLSHVPPVVQRWLERSNMVGREMIHTVYMTQKGMMRTTPDGSWMPVQAEQWFTIERPGFFWTADVKAAPGVHLAGRDEYFHGRGHMFIKALSLYTVADATGKEVDQSTMHRFMAEAAWFPSIALSGYLRWEQIDSLRARATMTYEGVTASGIFTFTPEGDMAAFEAQRYYDRGGTTTLELWSVRNDPDGFREFDGIRIGAKSSVTWKLKEGDFNWYRLEITGVSYNKPAANVEE
ncbi:MAG: DUF6544 family protein [Acidobacteriota bacterium]